MSHQNETSLPTYSVRLALNGEEKTKAYQLRHQVFFQEFRGETLASGLDQDHYDAFFEHLIVIENSTLDVVATYRMHSDFLTGDFYSKAEFVLDGLARPGQRILEVGRACVHPDFRNRIVLGLLWRGIAEYMVTTKSDLMMGCGTIKTENPKVAADLVKLFARKNLIVDAARAKPRSDHELPGLKQALTDLSFDESKDAELMDLVPPLMRSYMNAGAKLSSHPAWDPDFKCIDFLVVLDLESMDPRHRKRFMGM